jgi:hypothetical protein
MPMCDQCNREFKNDLALKIHVGRQHKSAGAAASPKKAPKPAKAGKGSLVCEVCDRRFRLPAHLARHKAAAHGMSRKAPKAARARKARRPALRKAAAAAPAAGPDVQALTVDQLIALKQQVDSRLVDIARQMRAAKVRF